MSKVLLSQLEKIKGQVHRLAHTGNTSVLPNDKYRKLMEAQVNDLYESYIFFKNDYLGGKLSRVNYRTLLQAIIELVDKDYLDSVPKIEFQLSCDWGKVR